MELSEREGEAWEGDETSECTSMHPLVQTLAIHPFSLSLSLSLSLHKYNLDKPLHLHLSLSLSLSPPLSLSLPYRRATPPLRITSLLGR